MYAALVMGMLRGITKTGEQTVHRFATLNKRLLVRPVQGRFATTLYAVYDPSCRELTFSNAGMPYPLLASGSDCQQLQREACPRNVSRALVTILIGCASLRVIQCCLPPTGFTNCKALTAMILAGEDGDIWRECRECRRTNRFNAFCTEPRICRGWDSARRYYGDCVENSASITLSLLFIELNIQFGGVSILDGKARIGFGRIFRGRKNKVGHLRVIGLARCRVVKVCCRRLDASGRFPLAQARSANFAYILKQSFGAISYAVALASEFLAGKIRVITPSHPASNPQHSNLRLFGTPGHHLLPQFPS